MANDGYRVKLLHIITGLNTGGAERALYALLAGGLARRFDCAVLSLTDEGTMGAPIAALGVPVYSLGMRAGMPGPGALWRLRHYIRSVRPDMIQGWMYHGNLAASLAARLAPDRPALAWNVRQCLYDLGNEKPLTRQVIRANRVLSRRPDATIYNSRLSREQHERFGFSAEKGVIIPNGFDLSLLRSDPDVGVVVRREFGLDPGGLVVGHVARFHPMKDHAGFLRAAVEVAKHVPQARFLLIGHDVSPDNPELAGIVPIDLRERFIFAGERRDVTRLMQAMDVLCLSSWSEAFPNVLGEAMACGVPCVTTDVGDSASIVGETGFVVPPSDSTALANALITMLKKPPSERRTLGLKARGRIHNHYSLDKVVDLYTLLYENKADNSDLENNLSK
jgi:glycosyltransferase involved in cell wall biosynthesis